MNNWNNLAWTENSASSDPDNSTLDNPSGVPLDQTQKPSRINPINQNLNQNPTPNLVPSSSSSHRDKSLSNPNIHSHQMSVEHHQGTVPIQTQPSHISHINQPSQSQIPLNYRPTHQPHYQEHPPLFQPAPGFQVPANPVELQHPIGSSYSYTPYEHYDPNQTSQHPQQQQSHPPGYELRAGPFQTRNPSQPNPYGSEEFQEWDPTQGSYSNVNIPGNPMNPNPINPNTRLGIPMNPNSNPNINPNTLSGRQLYNEPPRRRASSSAKRSVKSSPTLKYEEGTSFSQLGSSSPTNSETSRSKSVAKRSRMGCLTCRQRKKRCSESKPKCTECSRLGLNCVWPKPGTEHKNKPKEAKEEENTINHEVYGKIKVLRGIVEYKSA